ncbi:MAG: helix-turn-helix transcriptional regulator, partial [Pseudomonadota bacterium]
HVYLSKDMSTELLRRSAQQKQASDISDLSNREFEVFRWIGKGLTSREIAAKLGISARTVDSHRTHIKRKLDLHTGAELNRLAMRWAAVAGALGLALLLSAAFLASGLWRGGLAVFGILASGGALVFVLAVHREVDTQARAAIEEYRVALSLLASLQETSGALGELIAAVRSSSVTGLELVEQSVQRVTGVVRQIPLLSNPLTDLGLDAVDGVTRAVVQGADQAAQLAQGLEIAVAELDVTAMERQSRAVRQLAAELRREVDRGVGDRVGR